MSGSTTEVQHTAPSANTQSRNTEPRRTALHALHLELGARMVDFAGWEMPLQYADGIIAEHRQCRQQAVLFDVSHMGQLQLSGPSVAAALERIVPADIINLSAGRCRYTVFTDNEGGILDDLIVTNAGDHLYLVVNASRCEHDVKHIQCSLPDLTLRQLHDRALLAVQGPVAMAIVSQHCPEAAGLTFMQSMESSIGDVACRISRLGYTGEDGVEISVDNAQADTIARLLLSDERCKPAGLGARDSLRLEAGLCLYGNDIDESTTPVEASLLWTIPQHRRKHGGFAGNTIVTRQVEDGVARKLVGVQPAGRVPARQGALISDLSGNEIGQITSGCFGPTVNQPVAMGYVTMAYASPGCEVMLTIRGKQYPATVCALPFVEHRYCR